MKNFHERLIDLEERLNDITSTSNEAYQIESDYWTRAQWRLEARKQEERGNRSEVWVRTHQKTITEFQGRIDWLEKRLREAHAAGDRQAEANDRQAEIISNLLKEVHTTDDYNKEP